MALTGMSITCATAVSPGGNGALPFNAQWSENQTSTGQFNHQVPITSAPAGNPYLMRCWAAVDSWVAFSSVSAADAAAKAADPVNGPRWPVPGATNIDTFYDYYAKPGDFSGWALA